MPSPKSKSKKEFDTAIPTAAAVSGGGLLGGKAIRKYLMPRYMGAKELPVGDPTFLNTQRLYENIPDSAFINSDRHTSKPRWTTNDVAHLGNIGPYYDSGFSVDPVTKKQINKPFIYSPKSAPTETLAHELGHSLQSNRFFKARRLATEGMLRGSIPNSALAILSYLGHDLNQKNSPERKVSDAFTYGTGAFGGLTAGTLLANEVGASARGYRLMRQAGQKPNLLNLFGPNASYALAGAAFQGIPITLAIKRFLNNRKEKAALAATSETVKESSMSDTNPLERALGLITGLHQERQTMRNDIMRTILPEQLQPEELKQAEIKEETPKSLHAQKYDRRMKFNTALDRSGHSTTSEGPQKPKEVPEWLKEAAKRAFDTTSFDQSGVTGREGVITVEDELMRTPPLPTEEPMEYDVGNKPVMSKESESTLSEPFTLAEPTRLQKMGPAIGGVAMGLTLPLSVASSLNQATPGQMGILGLGSLGLGLGTYGWLKRQQRKHRERTEEFVQNLNRIANLPKTAADLYPQSEYDYPEESFTQRHPTALPILMGLGGAAAGAIPSAFLGGRAAVRSVGKQFARRKLDMGARAADATSMFGRATSAKLHPKILKDLKRKAMQAEEAFHKTVASPPEPGYHRALGQVGGGLLGGVSGAGLGTLGGLALNKPQPWEE